MRPAKTALFGLFVAATLAGCGGATIPTPPQNATFTPPPGGSPEMIKATKEGNSQRGIMKGSLPGS